ncbi:MAG: CpaF family protein [Firmicutes bacterium]|nr:CpaF family protein [Bacillota bacterium]
MAAIHREILLNPISRNLKLHEKQSAAEGVFNALRRELDFLEKYLKDPQISEIMVNGHDDIFIEKNGRIVKIPEYFPSSKELEEVIMRIGSKIHREINEMNPILDARLADGSRVHAVYKNIALNGPTLNIRKFPDTRIDMKELISLETVTAEAAEFLKQLVICGYNIFLSGGTSSGKTTFLNALSDFIPADERVIVIEDSAELQLDGIENIVRMETKNANVQGKGEINMKHLIKASLRMRPDRIIVGEIRGGEVMDMINSMNTGHSGSLCTGHANSARGMLSRIETMMLTASSFPIEAIRGQIASAIDIIVHLGRLKDRSRKILEITEVAGFQNGEIMLNPLFVYEIIKDKEGDRLMRTENPLKNTSKLIMQGGAVI